MKLRRGAFRTVVLIILLFAPSFYLHDRKGGDDLLTWPGRAALWILSPILRGTHVVRSFFSQTASHYILLTRTAKENEILKARIRFLETQATHYASVKEEHKRLAGLLEFRESLPFRTIAAKVIAYPPLSEFRVITVDRGSRDGVERGAAVVAPGGLVGRIIRVEATISQVLLMTDLTSAVDTRVRQTGARGLVVGMGLHVGLERDLFIGALEFWDRIEEVKEGDLLETSGLDGVFPPGIPVGRVRQIQKGKFEVFQEGRVVPMVDFNALQEVLIVRSS